MTEKLRLINEANQNGAVAKLACSYVQYVQHAIHPSASCQASRQSFTDLELEPLPFSFSRAEASSMRRQLAGHGTACCVTHTGRHQSQNLFITLALQKQLHEQGKGRRRTYVAPEVTNARTVREMKSWFHIFHYIKVTASKSIFLSQ